MLDLYNFKREQSMGFWRKALLLLANYITHSIRVGNQLVCTEQAPLIPSHFLTLETFPCAMILANKGDHGHISCRLFPLVFQRTQAHSMSHLALTVNLNQPRVIGEGRPLGVPRSDWPVDISWGGEQGGVVLIVNLCRKEWPTMGNTISWAGGPELSKKAS